MRRWVRLGGLILGLLACGDDATPMIDAGADAPDVFVEDAGPSCTVGLWDENGSDLTQWPDPTLLREDSATGTGFRLSFDAERFEVERFSGFAPVFTEDLSDLDGFGNNASAYFMFGRAFNAGALPTAEATADPSAGIGFVVLEETPRIQPALVRTLDDDATLLLGPMEPLPEQTWVAAYVTRALTAAAGGCLEPSESTAALLAAPDETTQQALDAMIDLGIVETSEEIVAISVFPVQTLTDDSRAIAADIAGRDYVRLAEPVCTDEEFFRRCVTSFEAQDYRGEDGAIRRNPGDPISPMRSYVLPVTAWLPLEGEGPFPTLVWGSGLGSGREQGARLARFAAPRGFATVAVDPVQHGEHPDVPEGDSTEVIATVVRFFAIGDFRTRAIEALRLRDHWRQSAYDKLQLVRLLQGGLDATGDGEVDLDADELGYLGVSLGGIMGSELLALSDSFDAGVLVVPGGRVSSIISESETFSTIVIALRPRTVSDGDVFRFFPVLQTILERGDAGSYGSHIVRDRFSDAPAPNILAGVVLDDDTVPNAANYHLMRAMRLPLLGDELRPVPGITLGPMPPVSANIEGTTAGFLQFDVVRDREGAPPETATHSNVGDSEQGVAAWLSFLESQVTSGQAVIEDPYVLTSLEHAE
ncbi:MAG: hypothetical protein AAGE52_40510 [Myxococcota bacterium]